MRQLLLAGVIVVAPTTGVGRVAVEERPTPSVLVTLHARLVPMFERYYPGVKSELRGTEIAFEHDTRIFLIHVPLKTGEWQDAREVKGPNRRGIMCTIELRAGRYDGQAILPQTFDERYFETLVMAQASPDERSYLYVHLSYPDTVDKRFLGAFDDVMQHAWVR